MRYLIIEHFKPGKLREVYRRFDECGRLLPDGLRYLDSWIAEDLSVCYQLMECEDRALIDEWIARWEDLTEFRVVPVIDSAEARRRALAD
ncbi:MAG TPA: DUF3303 family protein [candidate division Zixibacteria bacterium]|nr:DUF3303 family protein [candidate division Zixibacteria bacterium]